MNEWEETKESNLFGLGKESRLRAKRAKEEEKVKPEPLDPPFPYRVIGFDPIMVTESGSHSQVKIRIPSLDSQTPS